MKELIKTVELFIEYFDRLLEHGTITPDEYSDFTKIKFEFLNIMNLADSGAIGKCLDLTRESKVSRHTPPPPTRQ